MDIKEIALKVADSLRNKVDGISRMQSNQGLVRFAEAFIESYKADLLKGVGEPDNCSGCGGEPAGYVAHGSTLPRNIRVFKGCSILSKEEADEYMPECVTALYTTPQPDRTAELEQLRQQVADLEKERDELIEVKAAENASWNAGFNVQVDQLKKLTAERDAALNEALDFESDVDTVTQHNVELQLETIALKSALKVARDALRYYGGDKYGTFANEAYAKINEVLHD